MKTFYILLFLSFLINNIFSQEIKTDKTTDILGNRYYTEQSKLLKYSPDSTFLYSYDNFNFGNIDFVDVSNPYKILLFYKDFNTLVILDDKLSFLSSKIFNFTINNICWDSDGNYLVYDYYAGEFHKYIPASDKALYSKPFPTPNMPVLLFVQNKKTILVCKSVIYIFDNLLNKQKTIHKSANSYSIIKGELIIFDSSGKQIKTE